ncbi:MAG: hypothetical protein RLZZ303_3690 [Candidatus Hydrogenedentota bacterium]|jgi:hypothetical protein
MALIGESNETWTVEKLSKPQMNRSMLVETTP